MPVFSKVPLTPEDTVTFVVNMVASVLQLILRFCDLLLGLPIVAGQYVLCHLPSPHGEVYAAAGINHAQVIGRNGGFAIAGIASLAVVIRSLRYFRVFKKHTRIGVMTLPALSPVWKYLNSRAGSLTTFAMCMLQGAVGAHAQDNGDGMTDGSLDVVQAGFAGAIGALLLQIALGLIEFFVEQRTKKAASADVMARRDGVGPMLKARLPRQARHRAH